MSEQITINLTDSGETITVKLNEAARGPAGTNATVDQTIIDGSANAVSGNAVFDGLALKAPIASPTFTGIVTAPRITGRCDGIEVFCKAGLAINAGQVVYVTGASGNNIIIGLAQANAEPTSSKTIGISESTLAHNATGYVITEGLLTVSISAPTANEGDPIWLSSATAGGMVFGVANKPSAPNHIVYLGVVTRKTGNTVVEIYVKIQNGAELDELADVLISSPVEGQALMRGATLWENRSLAAADISDSTTAGRSLLTAADAAAQRTSLGLGTLATQSGTFSGTSSGTNTGDETDARIASLITAATSKATPVDADEIPITDSAASFGLKKLTFANLKATLKTYLDTLYVALTGTQTIAGDKTFSGQIELTGQAATNSTSAMTRDLGDARYAPISVSATPTTDLDISNSTSFAADAGLALALTSGTWEVTGRVHISESVVSNTAGSKARIDVTANAITGSCSYFLQLFVGTSPTTFSILQRPIVSFVTAFPSAELAQTASRTTYKVDAIIKMIGTGTLNFEWAQNVSNATPTRRYVGSYMTARRIGN